jgi:bisphosphoglycerate-independent phosphoglycerate mutase (AlkP superfamily)
LISGESLTEARPRTIGLPELPLWVRITRSRYVPVQDFEAPRLLDLAPTILATLGVPKGAAMEGESLL